MFEIANTGSSYSSAPITIATFDNTNGANPRESLISDTAGNLFGTTSAGGANNKGTVFEIEKTGSSYSSAPITLATFDGTNGSIPSGLIIDAAGNLFGTADQGGANGVGTVFEIAKTGSSYSSAPITIATFDNTNGAYPFAGLISDTAGNLFGTTIGGGANSAGTVFEIDQDTVAEPPKLTIAQESLTVAAGSSIDLGITAKWVDPDDTVSVRITGTPAFETVSAPAGDIVTQTGATYTITAPAGESVTGLTLSSSFPGNGHPANQLRVTASNTTPGETASAPSQTITVNTGPAATALSGSQGAAENFALSSQNVSTVTDPNGKSPVLDGGAGTDTLIATNGAATLLGGPGDTLTGGNGSDTFVFSGDYGANTITNYNVNKDILQLDKSAYTGLASMISGGYIQQSGTSTIITNPHNALDTITLNNLSASVLESKGHFSFV